MIVARGQAPGLPTRTARLGGRAGGVATAAGVAAGQATWTLATSAGLAALLVASEGLFDVLRLAGAAYLVWLGANALWSAVRGTYTAEEPMGARRLGVTAAFRQGLASNLGNAKMIVFFTSLLPQFAGAGASFASLAALGLVFCTLTFAWLTARS